MKFYETALKGAYRVELEPKEDERGYFTRVFCADEFARAGLPFGIVQQNRSFTRAKGTIRGLHYQSKPFQENRVIQCVKGRVYDVVVDLRRGSPTYGTWITEELSEDIFTAMIAPEGCAHGFQTLTDNVMIEYAMSKPYSPGHYGGIRWNDPFFAISWPIREGVGISEQDRTWPLVAGKPVYL